MIVDSTKTEKNKTSAKKSAGISLIAGRLPARLTVHQTALVLGFRTGDIVHLTRKRLLRPLGRPRPHAPLYFSAMDVERRAANIHWLNKATQYLYNLASYARKKATPSAA